MSEAQPKKAVIYCRVSDGKGGKRGDGLRSQQTACREFARNAGYDVSAVFSDDISGEVTRRPGMIAMLKFLKAHRADDTCVIIDSIDRFARDVRGHWDLRDLLREAGGRLVSPKMEFKDDADSRMVENIHATFAQHFREKNREQTLRRMRARVMNGFWVFQAPVGYKYKGVKGRGQMLWPDEPAASVVREALEGYARGRFETQAEVMRFLQDNPLFPKDSTGIVRHQRVGVLLNQPVYAGYVEAPSWGVPLRRGEHEPLISLETYQRIQERLRGINRAPKQRNLNEDFPLRGFVLCADCGNPLTACWSKGSHGKHPYYLCPKRGCRSYGKSIRRAVIEGEFEQLLHALTPSEHLFGLVRKMLVKLWDHRQAHAGAQQKALKAERARIERQVGTLLDRIVETTVPSVIATYEDRIRRLETERLLIEEKLAGPARSARSFDQELRTALAFLASPWKVWNSDRLDDKRTVLKLTFSERLRYARNEGFRTADLAFPFKLLADFCGCNLEMAHPARFERATSAFGGITSCSVEITMECEIMRHHTLIEKEFVVPASPGYASPRYHFLPVAYVVLTRNGATGAEELHG